MQFKSPEALWSQIELKKPCYVLWLLFNIKKPHNIDIKPSPSTSVVKENAAVQFCCEAP